MTLDEIQLQRVYLAHKLSLIGVPSHPMKDIDDVYPPVEFFFLLPGCPRQAGRAQYYHCKSRAHLRALQKRIEGDAQVRQHFEEAERRFLEWAKKQQDSHVLPGPPKVHETTLKLKIEGELPEALKQQLDQLEDVRAVAELRKQLLNATTREAQVLMRLEDAKRALVRVRDTVRVEGHEVGGGLPAIWEPGAVADYILQRFEDLRNETRSKLNKLLQELGG